MGNNSTPNMEAVTVSGDLSNRINITAGKSISIASDNYGNIWGAGVNIDGVNIEAQDGSFTVNNNGSKSLALTNSNVTANEVEFISITNGAIGLILDNTSVTAITGDVNANVSAANNKGVYVKANTSLNAQKDITLNGSSLISTEGVYVAGLSDDSRNNIAAQGNVTIVGRNGGGRIQAASVDLENVNLISANKNININGVSAGSGNVYFDNIYFNAPLGSVAVYSEAVTPLTASQSGVLSFGGNNAIVANSGLFVGKVLNATQDTALIFRANNTLSIEGNITFKGETEGSGATRKGIEFSGANTLNIVKGSQLSLLGENKGTQATTGGMA